MKKSNFSRRRYETFRALFKSRGLEALALTELDKENQKRPEKAVESWRRALELDPMNENARRGLRMFQQEPSQN